MSQRSGPEADLRTVWRVFYHDRLLVDVLLLF